MMLTHPTLDNRQTLQLSGMDHALVEQLQMADIAALSFEERFGLLVDRELTERDTRRLSTRLRQAELRQTACIEDIAYRIRGAWIRPCWPVSPRARGCGSITTS
jgi:hypothetical protein